MMGTLATGSVAMLVLLGAAHFLADFPLQGDFLAQAKNRHTKAGEIFWSYALPGHALIHGAFVMVITGSVWLCIAETIAHGVTDWLKCEEKISARTDQAVHLACKVAWWAVAIWSAP